MIDQFLSFLLFLFELLFFLFPSQVVQLLFFSGELFDSFLLFKFFSFLFFLGFEDFHVCLFKFFSHVGLFLLSCFFFLFLIHDFIFYLFLDQFSFKHFFLNSLDTFHFEFMMLLFNVIGIVHFLFVFFLQFLFHLFIILIHLLFLEIQPLVFNLGFHVLLTLAKFVLGNSLLQHVGHHKFRVESFNLVLVVMKHFICTFDRHLSLLDLQLFLFSIDFSSLDFLSLKLLDSLFVLLLSSGLDSVRPVLDSSLRFLIEFLFVSLSSLYVFVLLQGALVLDSLQFIHCDNNCILIISLCSLGSYTSGSLSSKLSSRSTKHRHYSNGLLNY